MQTNSLAQSPVGVSMGGAGAPMPSWLELWNEWEIQVVVLTSFSLQVILFFFAGIRRYTVSSVLRSLLWLVYLVADVVATYALGHMSSSLSKKSSGEQQLVAFWAPFLVLHLGGQDTITAYALEDNELWRRHLLNMFLQVAGAAYVLYKYSKAGGATLVRPAMLVLATGFVKYGERIWALMLASKKGSHYETPGWNEFLHKIRCYLEGVGAYPGREILARKMPTKHWIPWWWGWFTQNKQLRTYAFTVLTAHALRDVLVKPLIIDRNEASIVWSDTTTRLLKSHAYLGKDHESEDASAKETRHTGEMYKTIEVELGLMYDMLYTKAQVIHTWYGYCARAISLVSCFTALVIFTKSKRDGYTTPNIVITFALLGGACALEVASVIKAIVSTWTCATLKGSRWVLLYEMILFARYHLLVVKDGRWSDSVGQLNMISLNVHSIKRGLKGRIARLIGLRYWWAKAGCTKHPKLSPAVKKFVWGLLKGDKSDMVQIEDMAIQSGYWARRFGGFNHSEELDWSMSCEFQKSVLIWHIATGTFLNHPDVKPELVDKDMVEAVNTLSDYMMYLIVEHPDILPIKADARSLFHQTWKDFNRLTTYTNQTVDETYQIILNYKEERHLREKPKAYYDQKTAVPRDYPGGVVLEKAGTLARILLQMKLGLTYKMVIIGTVWMEMLCYAATNASDGFHARQLSNGGEFLTHILLLTKYVAAAAPPREMPSKAADKTQETSSLGHVELDVDDDCSDVIIEIR